MNLFRGFWRFFLGAALAIPLAAHAAPSLDARPYVLYYEGAIEGDTATVHDAAQAPLRDLDRNKADSEFFFQNIPGSDKYVIEIAVQAKEDAMGSYVRDFIGAHGDVAVGSMNLAWRRAVQVTEFFSISGFGPGQAGEKETNWGEFSRVRSFASLGDYTTAFFTLGNDLAQGNFVRAMPSVLNPVDASTFIGWVNGTGTPSRKLTRFAMESHSFFVMEDGSFASRGITYHLDKNL